jgi:hypothetical protein
VRYTFALEAGAPALSVPLGDVALQSFVAVHVSAVIPFFQYSLEKALEQSNPGAETATASKIL